MSQIKPYLFWIVIGAVLLLEIGYWVLSIPAVDVVGNKVEAQKAKTSLDTEFKHLQELDKRAKEGSPMGVFDAEKETAIRDLTNKYLITPAWKDVLEPHVKRYDEQLAEIKKHLAARSKGLNEPIASSSDKFGWYTAYQNLTEAQLKQLAAARALVMPASAGGAAAPRAFVPGIPGGAPAAAPAAAATSTTEPDFGTDAALRSLAGFFTKGAENPDPSEHPTLTRQFHTMERIIAVVLATSATNAPNPLAGETAPPEAGRVALAGVTWDAGQNGTVIGSDAGGYATGWRLTLNLQGPLSAILATSAAIERAGSDSPVMVVTGSEISRKQAYAVGERKDVGAEIVTARLGVLVLDFTDAPTGVKPVTSAPGGGAKPGKQPFGAGMPPMGFPGAGGGMMPPGGGMMPPGGGQPQQPRQPRSAPKEENDQ